MYDELLDAGCTPECQAEYEALPDDEARLCYLKRHRRHLVETLHQQQVYVGNVTFEPGCRNHWHIHHAKSGGGQILIVTAGRGWYQEWGKPARELKAGDVVNIPSEVKHWHGAAKDSAFQHLAIEVPGEETSNEWCEPVDSAAYDALP